MAPRYKGAVGPWWVAAVVAAVGYGVFLAISAARLPAGAQLTGLFPGQPAGKAAMAVLLAVAALWHPIVRERRWLVAALLLSAAGDFPLAIPWWKPAFVLGLGAFLVAHPCYVGALLPLRAPRRGRLLGAAPVAAACAGMLVWF